MNVNNRTRRSHRNAIVIAASCALLLLLPACSDSSGGRAAADATPSAGTATGIPAASARRSVPLLGPVPTHESASDAPSAGNVTEEFREERHRLKALIDANQADTVSLLKLAHLLHDAHLEGEAEPHYAAYTRRHPDNRQAWLDLATVQSVATDWASARASTEAMLKLYPDDPAGLYNLGAIFANIGEMDRATQTWERLVDQGRDPELAEKAASSLERLKSFKR